MLLTPRAPSTAAEGAWWLRLAPGELFQGALEELLDGPDVIAHVCRVRPDPQLSILAADVVEVRDVGGEALVGVGAFEGDEADTSSRILAGVFGHSAVVAGHVGLGVFHIHLG